ncbi:MAG: hemolysin family protein [Thermomicrobiales bacterium]
MSFGFEIAVILVLVLLNGLLAMAEFAVVSAQQSRLQERANNGSAGARAALGLSKTPDRFLATVQFGITLIGILAGAVGGAALADGVAESFKDIAFIEPYHEAAAFVLVVGATTYLSLVFGELVPKRLALQHPETIAAMMARPLNALALVGRPVVSLLSVSTRGILRMIGVSETQESRVTEEEIRILIEQGARSGVIEESEQDMALGILDLGDLYASDLMTPRRQIIWIDEFADETTNRRQIVESGHSYYPVFAGEPDNVLGFVAIKDLWREEKFNPRDVLSPPLFVPETAPAFNVMELFKQTGIRRALVVDEYGVIQGLITLHDIMEAIVGELDVPPEEEQPIVERGDGSWLIDGMVPVYELRETLGIELSSPDEPGRYQTLGGFIMSALGRVPRASDSVDWSDFRFEVMDMDRTRVDKVLVTPVGQAEKAERQANRQD